MAKLLQYIYCKTKLFHQKIGYMTQNLMIGIMKILWWIYFFIKKYHLHHILLIWFKIKKILYNFYKKNNFQFHQNNKKLTLQYLIKHYCNKFQILMVINRMNKMNMDGLLLWYWHFKESRFQNNGSTALILKISITKLYLTFI